MFMDVYIRENPTIKSYVTFLKSHKNHKKKLSPEISNYSLLII